MPPHPTPQDRARPADPTPPGLRAPRTGHRFWQGVGVGAVGLAILLSTTGPQPAAERDRGGAAALARALLRPQTPGATGLPFVWRRVRAMDFDEFRELRDELLRIAWMEFDDQAAGWIGLRPEEVPWEQLVERLEPAAGTHAGLAVEFGLTFRAQVEAYRVVVGRVEVVGYCDPEADSAAGEAGDRRVEWFLRFGAHGPARIPIEVFAVLGGRLVQTATSLPLEFTPRAAEEQELRSLRRRLASPQATVREEALLAMMDDGPHRLEPLVMQVAESDADPGVRRWAVELLAYIGTYDSALRLAALVADPVVAATAQYALARLTGYRRGVTTTFLPPELDPEAWRAWIVPREASLRRRLAGTE